MDRERKRPDTGIAIVIIIAGLLTGVVITSYVLTPKPRPRNGPEYRVVDSPAEAAALADAGRQAQAGDSRASGDAIDGTGEDAPPASTDAPPADAPTPGPADEPTPPPTGDDGELIDDAQDQFEAEGITEFVELTEELYIRISAGAVIMATIISQAPNDYPDAQEVMADYMRTQFVKERVDPEEFYNYTQWVASDHERAMQVGEKILREAEKHTDIKIDVSAVPGMSPAPVAPPED